MLIEALLIAVNAILWTVLFMRLRKKLSPEGIMKDARKELEDLLRQINGATDRDIRLMQAQLDRLKQATVAADELCSKVEERLAMLYGELDKASAVKAAESRLYPAPERPPEAAVPAPAAAPASAPTPGSAPAAAPASTPIPAPSPAAADVLPLDDTLNKSYSPVDSYRKEQMRFGPPAGTAPSVALEKPQKIEIPEFIKAEKPIEIKMPFKQRVRELRALGYSIEEIAHETGRSTQEVKITIEIS